MHSRPEDARAYKRRWVAEQRANNPDYATKEADRTVDGLTEEEVGQALAA